MAQAFSTTVPELQKELTDLIMKKDIKARIDSHNKIVYARQADQEVRTCFIVFSLLPNHRVACISLSLPLSLSLSHTHSLFLSLYIY